MSTQPENVLVIAKGFPPDIGGIETYSYEVASAYAESGKVVRVLASHIDEALTETSAFDWFLSVKQRSQASVAVKMLAGLLRLRLAGYSPDMIHATSWRVGGLTRLVWPRTPLAITVHGKEVFTISKPMEKLARQVLSKADRLIFVSEAIRQKFDAAYPGLAERTVVAWNGTTKFDHPKILPERETSAIFTVCRLVERKNIVACIEALALVRDRGKHFRYRIAGTGPEADGIRQSIEEHGLGQHVEMLGFTSEARMVEEYSRSALFLHPQVIADNGADIEGFGITIADAMQFACVPIAGSNGGPLDFIVDGETGYLVDGRDIDGLADLIEKLLDDPDKPIRIGLAAKRFSDAKLTWSSHVQTVIQALMLPK